jgi:hypothetical protein
MATKKKTTKQYGTTVVFENGSLDRWAGKVDEKLEQNELFHLQLLETINRQHSEVLASVSEVCGKLDPLHSDFLSTEKQVEFNTARLAILEKTINGGEDEKGLKQEVAKLQTKAGYISAVVSVGFTALIWLGKILISHITGK